MLIAACVKWVDLRPEVDRLHGTVSTVGHDGGFSGADRSAVEVALRLAEAWDARSVVVCAGAPAAEAGLRDLLASGVDHAVRIDVGGAADDTEIGAHTGEATAELLAEVLSERAADVVVCGDVSVDLGSGTVPAYLAHHLRAAQALGLLEVGAAGRVGVLRAVRRLDGGRREVLEVAAPAVLSVEGGVAELRRASLASTLGAVDASVEVRTARVHPLGAPPRLRPWRPPTRIVDAPTGGHALDRIVALTGALVDRTPPRTLELDPGAAADAIVEQLRAWGHLGPAEDPAVGPTGGV